MIKQKLWKGAEKKQLLALTEEHGFEISFEKSGEVAVVFRRAYNERPQNFREDVLQPSTLEEWNAFFQMSEAQRLKAMGRK
jgi:hypothetical protein